MNNNGIVVMLRDNDTNRYDELIEYLKKNNIQFTEFK